MNVLMYFAEYCSSRGDPIGGGGGWRMENCFFSAVVSDGRYTYSHQLGGYK